MTLCYAIEETNLEIEAFLADMRARLTSTTPIDIVFRSSHRSFVLYLSTKPSKEDEIEIAGLAHKGGFSDAIIVAASHSIALRISPDGTFLYAGASTRDILNDEGAALLSNAFDTAANSRDRTKAIHTAALQAAMREVGHIAQTKETTLLRNEKIEERLMDL